MKDTSSANFNPIYGRAIALLLGLKWELVTTYKKDLFQEHWRISDQAPGWIDFAESVVDGTLKWWQIWNYLELHLFFATPFLAIYLVAVAVFYWILSRTHREWWVFPALGLTSIVYLLLNVRTPFNYTSNLVLADGLGAAGLLGWLYSRRPLSFAWQVALLPRRALPKRSYLALFLLEKEL